MSEYIDRQAAIDAIYKRCAGEHWEDILRSLEPADVRPVVRGHDTGKCGIFQCSVCGYGVNDIYEAGSCGRGMPMLYELQREWNFCPNCGADMREAQP